MTKKTDYITLKSKIFTVILSLCFTFLLLEITIRFYNVYENESYWTTRWNPLAENRMNILPFRQFGFDPYIYKDEKRYITDRFQSIFALEKPDSTFRIICFGGSTTENENSYYQTKKTYPIWLSEKLNNQVQSKKIEVINMGYSAYATVHSLIFFELDALSWQPDLVILSHNINDLTASYFPNFTFDYSNKYGNSFYFPNYKANYTTLNVLFQWSQFYWFLKKVVKRIEYETTSLAIQKERHGKDVKKLLRTVFQRNLTSFIQVAKGKDVKVILGTQPFRKDSLAYEKMFKQKSYNTIFKYPYLEEFSAHHDTLNALIQKVGSENNIPVVKNAAFFRDQQELLIDCVHYSPEGVEILATQYAELIFKAFFDKKRNLHSKIYRKQNAK
jgi:hypothetical protein